jgi:hypothetical protein
MNVSACCRAVYMVLRVVLVRLHGGSLHPHQPLRQTDEEWSAPGDAQPMQPGEPCMLVVSSAVQYSGRHDARPMTSALLVRSKVCWSPP